MVVFGKKCLYSGKGGCVRAKLFYSKKIVCIQAKWLYSVKRDCIRAKAVVFALVWLCSSIIVVIGQRWLYCSKSGSLLVK